MSNNKKDTAKWALISIAIFIIIAALVFMSLQIFGQGKVKPSEWFKTEQTEGGDKEGGDTPAPDDGEQGDQESGKNESPVKYVLVAECSDFSFYIDDSNYYKVTVPEGAVLYGGRGDVSGNLPAVRCYVRDSEGKGTEVKDKENYQDYFIFYGFIGSRDFNLAILKPFDFTVCVEVYQEDDPTRTQGFVNISCVYDEPEAATPEA